MYLLYGILIFSFTKNSRENEKRNFIHSFRKIQFSILQCAPATILVEQEALAVAQAVFRCNYNLIVC